MNQYIGWKNRRHSGFTLLELLVIVAILAVIAGGLLVAYDGLEAKAAKAQATFNIAAVDKGVRAFKVVTKSYPDQLDSLLVATTTGTDSATAEGGTVTTTSTPIYGINSTLKGKVGTHTLTAQGLAALNAAGVKTLRYAGSSLGDNSTPVAIPNRIFDNTTRGRGIRKTLGVGDVVPVVESKGISDFTGAATSNSTRLRDISGLDENRQHIVVCLGLGNNSTIISDEAGRNAANFSEAPFYTDINKDEYGRFLLLFHLGSDTDGNGTVDTAEYFTTAKFIGVLDTKGDWYDEEYSEFTGQKL